MSDNPSNSSAPLNPPTPKIIIGDDMLLSLFKRAAAADQRKNEAKENPEHKGSEENELDSITIIIKYINGDVNICNRPKCGREITLDEALLRKLACSLHRTSAAVSAKAHRDITGKPRRSRNNTRGTSNTVEIGPQGDADMPDDDSVASDNNLSTVLSHIADLVPNENAAAIPIMFKTMTERAEDKEAQCVSFILNMKREVLGAYADGKHITYDGRFIVPRLSGDTRADMMGSAIAGLRDTLYRIWPRVRELKDDNAFKTSDTNTALVKVYQCLCRAVPAVVIDGYLSESCGGQVFVAVTEPNEEEYEVRYKFYHE